MKAMILAAGHNRRLRGLKNNTSKVLLPVEKRSLLAHNLALLRKYGFKSVVINLHAQKECIKDEIISINSSLQVHYSCEDRIKGTAGALAHARKMIARYHCLVLYGDNLTDFNLKEMIAFHRRKKSDLTVGVFDPGRTKWSGIGAGQIQLVDDGRVIAMTEKRGSRKVKSGDYVNAGVLIVSPRAMDAIPRHVEYDFSRDLIPKLLKMNNRVYGYASATYVLASDTQDAYHTTCRIARKLKLPKRL